MDGSCDRCQRRAILLSAYILPSHINHYHPQQTESPSLNKTLNRRRFQSPEVELGSATGPGTSRRRNSPSAPVTGRLDEPNDRRADGWSGRVDGCHADHAVEKSFLVAQPLQLNWLHIQVVFRQWRHSKQRKPAGESAKGSSLQSEVISAPFGT